MYYVLRSGLVVLTTTLIDVVVDVFADTIPTEVSVYKANSFSFSAMKLFSVVVKMDVVYKESA